MSTIKIFTKLLVIKIVANKRLGRSNSLVTMLSPFVFSNKSFNSVVDNEKKATSVPEISADDNNKPTKIIELNVVKTSNCAKNKKI